MPWPEKGEEKEHYVQRFMRSSEAQSDYPDEKQRLAVAYSMYEHRNSVPLYGQKFGKPKMYEANYIEPGACHYEDLGPCRQCGYELKCGSDADGQPLCEFEGANVLVQSPALAKMGKTLVGTPVVDKEHKDIPDGFIATGQADGIVTDEFPDPDRPGWRKCRFLVWDPECQKHCDDSVQYSVSCAYDPKETDDAGGQWHNVEFASEILDGEMTHLAIVRNPRYEGARIRAVPLQNSKGGSMLKWKFWEKGAARSNAAPANLDPEKEKVKMENGDEPSLKELYDAMPEQEKKEEAPKFNDDTEMDTPKGKFTVKELKENWMAKKNAEAEEAKKNAVACSHCNGTGKAPKENKEPGHSEHREGGDSADEHANDAGKAEMEENGRMKVEEASKANSEDNPDAAEIAAKKEKEEKEALELKQEKEKKEALENSRRAKGRKAFEDLRNARLEHSAAGAKIGPVSMVERLAKGTAKYGRRD